MCISIKKYLIPLTFLALLCLNCKSEKAEQQSVTLPPDSLRTSTELTMNRTQQETVNSYIDKIVHEIKTKEDVLKVGQLIMADAGSAKNKNNPAVKLFATLLKPLPLFEGIFWRLRGIAEEMDFIHLVALSSLRGFSHRDYLYGPHIKAIFDFVTQPTTKPTLGKIETITDLQEFLFGPVKDKLSITLRECKELLKFPSSSFRILVNLKLIAGEDKAGNIRYLNSKEGEKIFIKPYLHFIIGSLQSTLAVINYQSLYNGDKLPDFITAIGKKSAFNMFKTSPDRILIKSKSVPRGVTAKEINSILHDNDFKSLMTLQVTEEVAKKRLNEAFELAFNASKNYLQGFVCSIEEPISFAITKESSNRDCLNLPKEHFIKKSHKYIINPNALQLNLAKKYHEKNDLYLYFSKAFIKKETITLNSEVTGNKVKINLHRVFTPHPDLKVFYPSKSHFNNLVKVGHEAPVANGKQDWAWDYHYGRPVSYPDPTFGQILPEANSQNIYSILRTLRLTSVTQPLAEFLPIP